MELTFHNQDEFESFARTFMAGVAARDKTSPTVIGELAFELKPGKSFDRFRREVLACAMADTGLSEAELTQEINTDDETGDTHATPGAEEGGIVQEHIDLPPVEEQEPEAEKPKRKRRTKAEMEAAAMAEQRTLDPGKTSTPESPAEEPRSEMPVGEFVKEFVPPMVPSVAEALSAASAEPKPAQDGPKHQASAESLAEHTAAQAEYTPELIETLKGQAALFDADRTAHLKEGREAIAKHGFIKYMATFKGLNLDSGVAAYNDAEVKLHRAAIAHLMAS